MGASLADVRSRSGPREVLGLRRRATTMESAVWHWRRGGGCAHERRLALQGMRHHRVSWGRVGFGAVLTTLILVLIVISVFLSHEVLRAFVLVRGSVLYQR